MMERRRLLTGLALVPFWARWRHRHPPPPPSTTSTTTTSTTSTSSTTRPTTTTPASTTSSSTTSPPTTTTIPPSSSSTSTSSSSTTSTAPPTTTPAPKPFLDYDWTGVNPLAAWDVFDGNKADNGERSTSSPANVSIVADPSASGGVFLRLTVRPDTSHPGFAYTGVEMDNFYSGPLPGRTGQWGTHYGFGQGNPFTLECRCRYSGGSGSWIGFWAIDIDGVAAEIDGMETVNTRGPRMAFHNPGFGPADYGPAFDGAWHTYRIEVDPTGVRCLMDGSLRRTLGPSYGAAFTNANMGLRLKAAVGGSYPDGDAGATTPIAGTTFPQFFDCDYYRVFR